MLLRRGHKLQVFRLTGTKYKGCPAIPKYTRQPNTAAEKSKAKQGAVFYYQSFNHKEYGDIINAAVKDCEERHTSKPAMWFHDSSNVHKTAHATNLLSEHGITPLLLPPRSPDLTPLDYSVFGLAKRKWREMRLKRHMPYDDACLEIQKYLSEMDTDHILDQLPLRMEACIRTQGGHIERT